MNDEKEKKRFTAMAIWSFGAPLLAGGLIAMAFPEYQACANICIGLALMLLSGYYWNKN